MLVGASKWFCDNRCLFDHAGREATCKGGKVNRYRRREKTLFGIAAKL